MATMLDLLDAARKKGLPLEVTPDVTSNGHNGIKTQSPSCGYLHHTVSTTLGSVYKAPAGSTGWDTSEHRPDVPSPRCQVYVARARSAGCRSGCPYKGRIHLVFVSAGVAYQAGKANGGRISAAQQGKISAATPNAASSGLADTMDANDESMGFEIDWAEGENWPADLLELVCQLMALSVQVFRWPGVGCFIRHRQATGRKVDPETNYDFWARADAILRGEDASMAAWSDTDSANLKRLADATDRTFREGFRSLDTAGNYSPTAENYTVRGINAALDLHTQKFDTLASQNGEVLDALEDLVTLVTGLPAAIAAALQPPPPPEPAPEA
jgi:hypothetical protein